jgi:hypothetical protein
MNQILIGKGEQPVQWKRWPNRLHVPQEARSAGRFYAAC